MRMNVRDLILVGLCASLFGCAAPNKNYRPEAIDISDPPLATMATAQIGDTMLKQGKYIETDAILLKREVKVSAMGASYVYSPGYYIKEGEDKKSEFFNPEPGPEGGKIERGMMTNTHWAMQLMKSGKKICGVGAASGKLCATDFDIERVKRPALTTDGFQRTLIYNGRVGNKVKIGYREFSNSIARPAFSNEVEYDLNESMTIGYKGAEIEILEATNRAIKYRVNRNFNDASR